MKTFQLVNDKTATSVLRFTVFAIYITDRIKPGKLAQLCAEVFLNKLPCIMTRPSDKALSFMFAMYNHLREAHNVWKNC